MTTSTLVGFVGDHWVILTLILCPIVIVTMALAALSCEACGAPFGIFRRRSRTIDLCLRCALIHDIRHPGDAHESRERPADAAPGRSPAAPAREEPARQDDRRYNQSQTGGMGVAGHATTR